MEHPYRRFHYAGRVLLTAAVVSVVLSVLAGMLAREAEAITQTFDIQILDTSDTPSATVDGSAVTALPDSTGEFLHFSIPYPGGLTFTELLVSGSVDLVEPGSLAFSDRLFFGVQTTALDVQFASDPATAPVGTLGTLQTFAETGVLQPVGGPVVITFADGSSLSFNFSVASDLDAGPEAVGGPATLLLLGVGLAGITGVTSKRLRRRN